ncbi:MAG: leucine-rich repeat domain-containing protein [Candidatus Dependentiae bacterium]|jgi:Leucine-rich repeat (LRR) protein
MNVHQKYIPVILQANFSALLSALFLCLLQSNPCSAGQFIGRLRGPSDDEVRKELRSIRPLPLLEPTYARSDSGRIEEREEGGDDDSDRAQPVIIDLSNSGLRDLRRLKSHPDFHRAEVINLSHNSLKSLSADVFDGCEELRTLVLSGCDLELFDDNCLRGLTSLENLDLSRNNLNSMPESLLHDCSLLRSFNCASNNVRLLPDGLFESCSILRSANISRNPLTALPATLMARLPQMKTLVANETLLNSELSYGVLRDFITKSGGDDASGQGPLVLGCQGLINTILSPC